jgi:serine/threonine-protein kinase RsbW
MATDALTMTIPAKPEYVGVVRLAASGILSRMQFTAEEIEDVKVALSEACTNAIQYAYPTAAKKSAAVTITLEPKRKAIQITVADTGKGFDTKNPPSRKLHDNDIHMGLGLVFIKNLMDDVVVSSRKGKGTTIVMTKKVKNSR